MRKLLCRLFGHAWTPRSATLSPDDVENGYSRITVWSECRRCRLGPLAELTPLLMEPE